MNKPTTILHQVQQVIADQLNGDDMLSAASVLFIPENAKDIDFEVTNALGKQGIVGLVMTPEATYQGITHNGDLVWDLRNITVQIVENVPVNRGLPNSITALDAGQRVEEVLGSPQFTRFGVMNPVSIEQGEEQGLMVCQAKFNCQIHTSREEPEPVIPTKSGVKFSDGGFLEIQNSNANIWHQSQSTSMYFFPLAGRPIGNGGYVDNVEEVTLLDSGTGNALQAIMTPSTCKRVYIGPNWYFQINNMFQYATSLEEVIFIGRTMEQVQAMDGYPWGITDTSKIKVL